MKKRSLVQAKTHLSELVDGAEHHSERVLILRHGKPAAAIVPVSEALRSSLDTRAPQRMTRRQVSVLLSSFGERERKAGAVALLLNERR